MSSDHRWVSNREYSKLQREARRVYQAEQEIQNIKERTAQKEREIKNQYQASVDSLHSQINTMSRQHDAELQRQSEEHRRNIAQQNAEFTEAVRALDRRINELVSQETDERTRKRRLAEISIAEMEDWLASVASLGPERYNAGESFAHLSSQLQRAKERCNLGLYESADGIAGVRLDDVAALYAQVNRDANLFRENLQRARLAANQLRENIGILTSGKPVHSFNHNGNPTELNYDINHWIGDRFKDLVDELGRLESRLEAAENGMVLDELTGILDRLEIMAGEGDGSLQSIDATGKERQIRSIAVEEHTRRIMDLMKEREWELIDTCRSDDDNTVIGFVFKDPAGNSVAFELSSRNDGSRVDTTYDVYTSGEGNTDSRVARDIEMDIGQTLEARIDRERTQRPGIELGENVHNSDDCRSHANPESFIRQSIRP